MDTTTRFPIRPMTGRVIVKRLGEKDLSEGGIIIPQCAQQLSNMAVVVAVGDNTHMTEGLTVLLDIYSGTTIKHEGEDYLILKEEDILAWYETSYD